MVSTHDERDPSIGPAAATFHHILCAVDFSPCSRRALDHAVHLARELEAELILLHIYQLPTFQYPEGMMPNTVEVMQEVEKRSQAALERWRVVAERELGRPVRALIEIGTPGRRVAEMAEKLGADVIVLGTHGRTGIKRLLLGSVAERVMRHAKCPVLTLHSSDDAQPDAAV